MVEPGSGSLRAQGPPGLRVPQGSGSPRAQGPSAGLRVRLPGSVSPHPQAQGPHGLRVSQGSGSPWGKGPPGSGSPWAQGPPRLRVPQGSGFLRAQGPPGLRVPQGSGSLRAQGLPPRLRVPLGSGSLRAQGPSAGPLGTAHHPSWRSARAWQLGHSPAEAGGAGAGLTAEVRGPPVHTHALVHAGLGVGGHSIT